MVKIIALIFLCKQFILRIVHVANSCNTGTSTLPDVYAQRPRASADISGNARVATCVATNMLQLRHSKNLPELVANRSAYL